MAPIKESLSALAASAQRLNAESDTLNATICEVEDGITQTEIDLTVWLGNLLCETAWKFMDEIYYLPDDSVRVYERVGWVIGYARIGDGWRIAAKHVAVTRVGEGEPDPEQADIGSAVALTSAPRAVQVEAAPALELLVETLTSRAEKLVEGIERAKKAVAP